MSENRKLVNFKAPTETVEKAKNQLEHGQMSEELRHCLKRIAHGEDVAEQERVKDLLRDKRREKREYDKEIENLRREKEETVREIERLEDRLDELANQEGEYEGYLKSLTQDLQDGAHLFEGHKKIREAAQIGDVPQEQVIESLKERNPEIDDSQFESARGY